MVKTFKLNKINGTLIDIIQTLSNAHEELYVSEIQKAIKVSKATIAKWLREMKETGLIIERNRGNLHYFKINLENPIVKHIKILQNVAELLPIFSNLANSAEVYLYGSSARGEDRSDSDYDILIITRMAHEEALKLIKKSGYMTKREIKITVLKPFEYVDMATKDPAFYQRVEIDKIRLV